MIAGLEFDTMRLSCDCFVFQSLRPKTQIFEQCPLKAVIRMDTDAAASLAVVRTLIFFQETVLHAAAEIPVVVEIGATAANVMVANMATAPATAMAIMAIAMVEETNTIATTAKGLDTRRVTAHQTRESQLSWLCRGMRRSEPCCHVFCDAYTWWPQCWLRGHNPCFCGARYSGGGSATPSSNHPTSRGLSPPTM